MVWATSRDEDEKEYWEKTNNYVGSLSTEDEHDEDDDDDDEDESEEEEGRCEYLESWPTLGKQVRIVFTYGPMTFEINTSIEQLIS